jgi:glutathione synthase/RimK-type ligase-like ATP-grasp enzyme
MKNPHLFKLKQHLAQYRIVEWYRRRHIDAKVFKPAMLDGADTVTIDWPADLPKPRIGLVKDCGKMLFTQPYAYWPRYERFLKNNRFAYEFYDIRRSDWMAQADRFDVIVWRTESDPASQYEAENKIRILEMMGKKCLPSFDLVWSYEDKIRQAHLFSLHGIPAVPTFISYDRDEALAYVASAPLPIVSKLATGSGSMGVELFRHRDAAERFVRRVFAPGNPTYWTYLRQKDYVYFQEFFDDAAFDLRVIVIGDQIFGYYRMRPEDDFRASGAGKVVKKEIPEEALRIAVRTARAMGAPMIAVDMIHSERRGGFFVIEASISFQIDTHEQLKLGDTPGYYRHADGRFTFVPGRFWVQELALRRFLETTYLHRG